MILTMQVFLESLQEVELDFMGVVYIKDYLEVAWENGCLFEVISNSFCG